MEKEIQEIDLDTDSNELVKPIKHEDKSHRKFRVSLRVPKFAKFLLIPLAVLLVISVILGVVIGIPALKISKDATKAYVLAKGIKDAAKSQDISKITSSIVATKDQIVVVEKDLNSIAWTQKLPFVGAYTADAIHGASAARHGLEAAEIMTKAVEPYADILGLRGQGTFVGGTAEARIMKMVETLDKVTPQIDSVAVKMAQVKKDIESIDPNRYPETLKDKPVRSSIVEAKNIVNYASTILSEATPLVKNLPTLLGANREAKYMILFQNDKELRPTGGFITAYAIFRVEKGKISLNEADDIYKLDDTVKKNVTPPAPIQKYLNVYGWRLRDANFSPDYEESMKTFSGIFANSTKKQNLDGIVTVDTHFLVRLMEIVGPVEVYGQTYSTKISSECNCPMVVYELLKAAGTPRGYWVDNRKDMIGLLLQALMKKAMAAPKQVYAPLFQSMFDLAYQKHLLVYLNDPASESGLRAIDFAGKIKSVPYDYVHVSDANLGGAKSNLYVERSFKQDTNVTDSGTETTLTISYRYPRKGDNCSLERKEGLCLAGIYRNYMRVYLPKSAKITSVNGFENKSTTFAELDHQVVDGFTTIVPQGLGKVTVKYTTTGAYKTDGQYRVLIQKQPGTLEEKYQLIVNGKMTELKMKTDQDIVIKL